MNGQIESFIDSFNSGWTRGESERIAKLLHDEVIFVAPDLKTEIRGRDNCIQTIKDYNNSVKTVTFEVRGKGINIWGDTAMVSLDYYVEYEMNGEFYKENGKEFWTLCRESEGWKLVWRAMVRNENVD